MVNERRNYSVAYRLLVQKTIFTTIVFSRLLISHIIFLWSFYEQINQIKIFEKRKGGLDEGLIRNNKNINSLIWISSEKFKLFRIYLYMIVMLLFTIKRFEIDI